MKKKLAIAICLITVLSIATVTVYGTTAKGSEIVRIDPPTS